MSNFDKILKQCENADAPITGDNVFQSFNHFHNLITSKKTIALVAGTARPTKGVNSIFYYLSLIRMYSILDLVNAKLEGTETNWSFKETAQAVKNNKLDLKHLCERIKDNPISFIDTLSFFQTNDKFEYKDNKLLSFRIDYDAFKELKNVRYIFVNSKNTEKVMTKIAKKLNLSIEIIYFPLFKFGKTNDELAQLLFNKIK